MKQTTLNALAGLVLSCSVHAASFDCAKAQVPIEKLICTDAELSKLDKDLATAYAAALRTDDKATSTLQAQKLWLKARNSCIDASCAKAQYQARISILTNVTQANINPSIQRQIETEKKAGFKGEYFLSRSEDTVCIPFTKNLNQFRNLDFDECASRLSEKFPEFSRPEWKEVPLDLEIAEKAFKDLSLEYEKSKAEMAQKWQHWLKETADLRAAGKVKMWLTEVDINHDGILDPIARVQYAHPASSLPVKQRGCVYSHSGLRFLAPSPELFGPHKHFYFSRDADIIHSDKTGHSYSVEWSEGQVGPILEGQKIGATRGVLVELSREAHSSPIPVCHINWVPTGNYRPLQRNTKSTQSIK